MVFGSLFNKSNKAKKQAIGKERARQFKDAWLLANRSLLAAKQQNEKADTAVEENSLENKAQQFVMEQKESFSSDARLTEQLTAKLMPIVDQIYAYSNRYVNDADVSSAHNTTYQRILELVMEQAASGEPFDKTPCPADFSDEENKMLNQVTRIVNDSWANEDAKP
ncbi:MAG: hypothetical protein MK108_15265 [Mariniblastus sp.]|nr:hypothetical protein [Mariniblastus sp.]